MKKVIYFVPEKEFDDWFKSWMESHYKIMNKQQRENMNSLYRQLKQEVYHNV